MKMLSLTKRLSFRVALPVLATVVVAVVLVAALATVALSRFDEERQHIRLSRLSQRTYLFCESAFDELVRAKGEADERRVRIAKVQAMAALEDFFRSTGLQGVVFDGQTAIPLSHGLPKQLPADLAERVRPGGSIVRVPIGRTSYFATAEFFRPWGWQIVIASSAQDFAQLIRSMRIYYGVGFVLALLMLVAIFIALNAAIRRPIEEIAGSIRGGDVPRYRGVAEFEYLSDQLREAIQKRNTLLTNIERTHFIYVYDTDGRITYLSPAVTSMLGYTEEDFATHYTTYLTSHPANRIAVERAEQSIKGIQQPTWEVEVFHKDGTTRWLEVTEVPVFDDRGRVAAVEGIARDITDRKRMEDELRENQKLLSSLMASLPGMAYRCRNDRDGTVEFVSDGCLDLTGYRPQDLTGSRAVPFASLIHPEDRGIVMRMVGDAVAKGESYRLTYRIFRADGTMKWVWEQGQALPAAGDAAGRVGFITDITETKRLEEELLKAQKLESLGVLAGGIAHDFNNLLQAILGNIALAKFSANAPDKLRERLDEAELSTRRASELSNRLLTFSVGGRPLRKIGSVVAPLREALHVLQGDPSVTTELAVADDLRTAEIDESQLLQVFQNVLHNARDAMPGGGKVRIHVSNAEIDDADGLPVRSGEYVKISIADSGTGIPKEHLARVFDPYYTTKDMGARKGRGLGLTVCHSIVTKHNGVITVDSSDGGGAVVTILLPAALRGVNGPNRG